MAEDTLETGQRVLVIPLNKSGTVRKFISDKKIEVEIGGMMMRCKRTDLRRIDTKETKKDPRSTVPKGAFKKPLSRDLAVRHAPRSVDLHGKRVHEVVPIIENAIDLALRAGNDDLRIMHGLGTGKVQDAVHRYLSSLPVVKHFTVETSNPGVTIVYF